MSQRGADWRPCPAEVTIPDRLEADFCNPGNFLPYPRLTSFQKCVGSINSKTAHFPPPPGHLSFDFKIVANAPRWASLRVQMPHGGDSVRVQMANLWNKKTIIARLHRICNCLNSFLTVKTGAFSRTVHVLLFAIPRAQVETIVQTFAHAGVAPYATFKVRKDQVVFDNAPPSD